MKAFALTPYEPVPSNLSDEELLKHVQHVFPEPGSVLKLFFQRYEEMQERIEAGKGAVSDANDTLQALSMKHEVQCPHCGSTIGIDTEVEWKGLE